MKNETPKLIDLFIDLGKKQVSVFSDNHIGYMECMVIYAGMRKIMLNVYDSLVYRKKIEPLELIPVENKLNIWKTAREIAKERLNKKECIELSKILYTIEYYLN